MSSRFGRLSNGIKRALHMSIPIPTSLTLTSQYPILIPLTDLYAKIYQMSNRYTVYRTFKEIDPELYGAVDRIAKMVRYSYGGFYIHAGGKLTDDEIELQRRLNRFDVEWDVAGFYQASADRLVTYGDDISLVNFGDGGLEEWRMLPIENMTIVENRSQLNDPSQQVWKRGLYVMNENGTEGEQTLFRPDQILHISLNSMGALIYDVMGRFTFGVWSLSPMEPLKYKLLWKLALMINDMLLRQKLVPREHFKLDMSMFDPAFFAGETQEARITAAKNAATSFLSGFKTDVATPLKEVDKSYITGKEVEIDIVEPKHVSYVDPNPLFDQINQSIWAVTAPLESAVLSRSRQSYASEMKIGSVADLIAETVANVIKEKMLGLVKEDFKRRYGYKDEDLDKIDLKIQLAYGVQQGELIRQAAVLSATNCFTVDEIREMLKFEPLTEEQRAEIAVRIGPGRAGQNAQTVDDILRDYIRRQVEPEPITPESRIDKQVT